MSRSNKTDLVNPAVRYFEWAGDEGFIRYYDKEAEQNVSVDLPFRFLILDRVTQVGGGIDRGDKYEGFWSNAVRNIKTQAITVRSKQGIEAQGLYEDIKGTPGVKFITGLYVAFKNGNPELEIGYLKLKGAALTAWIDFTKAHRDIYNGAFGIVDKEKKKKGKTDYYAPVFQHFPDVSAESESQAVALDEQLQEYLTAYFAQAGIEEVEREFTGEKAVAVGSEYDAQRPIETAEPEYTDEVPF